MKGVEATIHNSQDWLESAIRLVNNIEVFTKAILKLLRCAFIFLNATNFQINEHWLVMMEIKRFGRAMECKCMEEIHSLLRKCTQQDYASLRLKLENLQNDTRSSNQQDIVTILLKFMNMFDLLTIEPKELTLNRLIGIINLIVLHEVNWSRKKFTLKSYWRAYNVKQITMTLASHAHPHVV